MGRFTARRADGNELAFAPGGKTTSEKDMLRCCHCGVFWYVLPGSGRQRGFCMKCGAPTCGAGACRDCNPWRKRLDDQNKDAVLRQRLAEIDKRIAAAELAEQMRLQK